MKTIFKGVFKGVFKGKFFFKEDEKVAQDRTVRVLDNVGEENYLIFDENSSEVAIIHATFLASTTFIPDPVHSVE